MFKGTFDVKLLTETAKLPTRGNATDAGLDLRADMGISILPRHRRLIKTGISIAIPDGYVAYVKPRSGLASKSGIDVMAGVIDSSYRGEVMVLLINFGNIAFSVYPGDRIAQLVIQKVELWNPCAVDELDETERGSGGFGSTGR